MKTNKLFATLFLMLVFIIKITAQVPPYVPTNGLVAWWPFTGNANDLSGNGNNGINNGATLTTDRFSNSNSAYNFNGTSNYIQAPNYALQGSITFSGWYKMPTFVIPQYDAIYFSNQSPLQISLTSNAIFGWRSYQGQNGHAAYVKSPLIGYYPTNQQVPSVNVWHHFVVVFDNGVSLKMYLDNNLIYTNNSVVNNSSLPSLPMLIGYAGSNGTLNYYYLGQLDDIGIWNRALSLAEVATLYNAVSCVAPIASITTQGNSTFCAGGSCTLNANAGNSYTYQWYNNGTLINGATAITFTASQAGNYTVKVTDGLTSCFTTSQPQSVIVNPQPNVSFGLPISSCWVPGCVIYRQINASTIPLNGTPNGGTYQGPGISGSAFSPTVAGLGNKNLKYTYTDNNGCSNFANQSVIIYDTIICPTVSGIIKNSEDLLNEESVKIYPNPNQGFFNLELTECKNSIIKITDVLGKTILNQKAELFNEIDLKNQSSGVYTINIITDKKIKYSTKVIKE